MGLEVLDAARAALKAGAPACLVRVSATLGSTPREIGATMLVLSTGTFGTIGGGGLEHDAIARARALLAKGETTAHLAVMLGPDADQCCGGKVELTLHRLDAANLAETAAGEAALRAACPAVLLFGAGHVGRALAVALRPLPLNIRWIEARADAFPPDVPPEITTVLSPLLLDEIARAPRGAAILVVTHSHALDFMLCEAALRRGDFAYLGLIGSKSKKARFLHELRDSGVAPGDLARLTCPIGGQAVADKRPEVIAALTAAEMLAALAAPREPGEGSLGRQAN